MIINFTVVYFRNEYLSIVTDFALDDIRDQMKKKNPDKEITSNFWFTKKLIRVFGSITFFSKKRKMPFCEFTFTSDQITRKTDLGLDELRWSEITNIKEYTDGMIILLGDSGLPIPYRCISNEEKEWIIDRHKQLVIQK